MDVTCPEQGTFVSSSCCERPLTVENVAFRGLTDLVFAALRCACSSRAAQPPDALLLTTSSLALLDQAGAPVLRASSSTARASTLRTPQLYTKEPARSTLPCRWLQAERPGGGPGVSEVKVLRLPRHALHVLPPPLEKQVRAATAICALSLPSSCSIFSLSPSPFIHPAPCSSNSSRWAYSSWLRLRVEMSARSRCIS